MGNLHSLKCLYHQDGPNGPAWLCGIDVHPQAGYPESSSFWADSISVTHSAWWKVDRTSFLPEGDVVVDFGERVYWEISFKDRVLLRVE